MTSSPERSIPASLWAASTGELLPLVPYPRTLTLRGGSIFLDSIRVATPGGPHDGDAKDVLEQAGIRIDDASVCSLTSSLDSELDPEAYSLTIDKAGIQIRGGSDAGVFYALQTLAQLLRLGPDVPFLTIEDAPHFRWRGMLLDVARHFMPLPFLYKCVDLISHHKLNVFHLHLTDDQGWRVEIRKYPRLTEVGAHRRQTLRGHGDARPYEYDGTPHGGHYSQEELRGLVAYAARRHVTIIPAIDLPGHMQAAIAAYPRLGNEPEVQHEVCCRWGVFDTVLNLEESTFEFLEDVLREVFDIFPSEFVHLGGDECRPDEWGRSERVAVRMRELNLARPEDVQPYIMNRMAGVLRRGGRTFVGWDEVLKNTRLERDAVIMAWQPRDNSLEALHQGFRVVMTPNNQTYLDHYQKPPTEVAQPLAIGGHLSWERLYDWEVYPPGTPDELQANVLGAQVQLWTEYVPTPEHAEFMLFPRLSAFSEVVWTYPQERHHDVMRSRLAAHLAHIDVKRGPL